MVYCGQVILHARCTLYILYKTTSYTRFFQGCNMAHVAKVKSSGVSPMVAHYAREAEKRGYVRENIDPERTADNYAIGAVSVEALAERVRDRVSSAVDEHERTAGRAVRKDANVMMDWVVTAPKDLKTADQRRFFDEVVGFIQDRYGRENVPGGFVHMDETSPHVHVPMIPVVDGRLVAAKVVNRADLRTFHKDLGRAVDDALGYHVSIELDEQQRGEKQLSHLSQRDYIAAKDEIAATKTRLEHLRREVKQAELEPPSETFSESARSLWEARSTRDREKSLRSEISGLREQISALEGECAELGDRAGGLGARCEAAREQVRVLAERVRGFVDHVGERMAAVLNRFGVRAYAGAAPLSEHVRDVRDASRELGRAGSDQERGRGWDMSR